MCEQPAAVRFALPDWVAGFIAGVPDLPDPADRMALVVAAARQNVDEDSGGPFAAAVFARDTGRLVALGVNRVIPEGLSILHAEMVALSLAQRKLGTHDLGEAPGAPFELVASVEPCAMCLGAVPWSGVARLVAGARDADARAAGFDEGAKPADWPAALETRGIDVLRDVHRERAAAVLVRYRERNGRLY